MPNLASIAPIMLLGACGDNLVPVCDPTGVSPSIKCSAALTFASRDTQGLIPQRAEVDRYFDRWIRATAAEPIFGDSAPQVYRTPGLRAFEFFTTNTELIDSWTSLEWLTTDPRPAPHTGVESFDKLLDELVDPYLNFPIRPDRGDGTFMFSCFTQSVFNEEVLNERLVTSDSFLPDPVVAPRSDGTWGWYNAGRSGSDDATADILFDWGFGDCISGCDGFHRFEAIVPAVGDVVVYDLGGDPIPPGFDLSPNTRPKP